MMFSMTLFKKELREFRWKIIIGLVFFIITAASIPLTFNYIKELLHFIPEMPGLEGFDRYLANFNIYTWSQWSGKNLYSCQSSRYGILGRGNRRTKTVGY